MRAFVGGYTADGLAVLEDGALTHRLPVPNASWLAFSPDRSRLYAVHEQRPGSVTVLSTETLAVLDERPTGGDEPTHLTVHGDRLLVANYGSGSVAALGSDGRLDVVTYPPGAHAHQVVTDPTGRWIVAVDIAHDTIHVSDDDLHEHHTVTVPGGPRHIVWHPDGRRAYVVCEYVSQVVPCTWSDGDLTPGVPMPTVAPGSTNYPGEIVMAPDGRFLYVTNRGDNSIAVFAIDDEPRLTATVPCGGDWPRHATLDPTGRLLYVANQRSGTVTWLPCDPTTGALSEVAGSVSVPDVAMVVFE